MNTIPLAAPLYVIYHRDPESGGEDYVPGRFLGSMLAEKARRQMESRGVMCEVRVMKPMATAQDKGPE